MATERKIDVMISSYDLFRANFNDINAVEWACIIFDEARVTFYHLLHVSVKLNQIIFEQTSVVFALI